MRRDMVEDRLESRGWSASGGSVGGRAAHRRQRRPQRVGRRANLRDAGRMGRFQRGEILPAEIAMRILDPDEAAAAAA